MSLVTQSTPPVTRRDVARLIAVAATLALSPARAAVLHRPHPVVGFHNDAPWLDASGRDLPYVPPCGVAKRAADCESLVRIGHFL